MPSVECGFQHLPGVSGPEALARFGPTLIVEIGFDPNFQPTIDAPPDLPADRHPALVDTGAAESCIDSTLAIALNLPIVDRQKVAGVHGSSAVDMHLEEPG